jgi:peroxiredoxin
MRSIRFALGLAAALSIAPSGMVVPAREARGADRVVPTAAELDTQSGIDLIGRPAPAWSFDRWIASPSQSLADLRGKVVLLRWWTEDCSYCAATLPGLERLRARDAARGLVVIGVFHPKPPHHVSDAHIQALAGRLGFSGPIAVDERWHTLDRYWLTGHPERQWTSVSFLIDRDGFIRWVHGGGEYHPSTDPHHAACALQYQDLEEAIEAALAAKATPAPADRKRPGGASVGE